MTLQIDPDSCVGHGRCYALFPELFAAEPDGTATVSCVQPTAEQLGDARMAVENCPEGAIELTGEAAA